MLVKPNEIFAEALNMQYAVGAFNTYHLEVSQAILWAAQEQRSPVIIQTSESAIKYAGLPQIVGVVTSLAKEIDVPVVLHLDHGKSLTQAQACIDAGYTSVMIDAGTEPLAKNIAITKEVVAAAHKRGVWVEAELGAILGVEGALGLGGEKTPEDMMTKPAQAREFVDQTGIDALAVSVGTIHGAFSGQEYIRWQILEELQQELPNFPLVVHGASGIGSEDLTKVASTNVCKVNVDTEIRIAFEAAVKSYFDETHNKVDPRDILRPARDAAQAVVAEKMKIFGSAGRAK